MKKLFSAFIIAVLVTVSITAFAQTKTVKKEFKKQDCIHLDTVLSSDQIVVKMNELVSFIEADPIANHLFNIDSITGINHIEIYCNTRVEFKIDVILKNGKQSDHAWFTISKHDPMYFVFGNELTGGTIFSLVPQDSYIKKLTCSYEIGEYELGVGCPFPPDTDSYSSMNRIQPDILKLVNDITGIAGN